jgi:dephospho-CoA kinase
MLRVGLTGGIGCGKSTVAAMMGELGCHIINADKMAHAVIAPDQPAYTQIRREFGASIVATDGTIDRARLASIVFSDPTKLAALNAIIHPHVLRDIDSELERLAAIDPRGVAVVEAALLIESGYHLRLDRLVLVSCTREQQLERLTNPEFGRAMSRVQAEQRMNSQMPLEAKRKLAKDEIDCSGSLEYTREQVQTLVDRLKKLSDSSAVREV